jgi:hypothetical protein
MTQIASIRAETANKKLSKSSSQNYPTSFSENAKASGPSSFIGSSTGNPFLKSGLERLPPLPYVIHAVRRGLIRRLIRDA